ncbi:hypothetical protein, partial [Vogesella alkaliphila]|uniref:hypothetical protein n=1 Tax=Vogesella alkaliphila TaxID=1193621 RepID=UPI001E554685
RIRIRRDTVRQSKTLTNRAIQPVPGDAGHRGDPLRHDPFVAAASRLPHTCRTGQVPHGALAGHAASPPIIRLATRRKRVMPKNPSEQKQSCAGVAHENIALLKNNALRQTAAAQCAKSFIFIGSALENTGKIHG